MKKSTWMKARYYVTCGAIGLGQGATAFWTVCQILGSKKLISKIAYGVLGVTGIVGQQYAYYKFVDHEIDEFLEQEDKEDIEDYDFDEE